MSAELTWKTSSFNGVLEISYNSTKSFLEHWESSGKSLRINILLKIKLLFKDFSYIIFILMKLNKNHY